VQKHLPFGANRILKNDDSRPHFFTRFNFSMSYSNYVFQKTNTGNNFAMSESYIWNVHGGHAKIRYRNYHEFRSIRNLNMAGLWGKPNGR